jgi:transcriptional regulator with XRE-family HTH domain
MVELSEDANKRFKDVFKRQLKYLRTEVLRYSQEETATKLNISVQYYKNMEHGIAMPSTKMLIRLAEELGFRVDYLFLYLLNDVKCNKKSQEQLLLDQINNTCSDSERRALIYHWNMYMNPKNKSGFNIVEDSSFTPDDDDPAKKRRRNKEQAD